MPARESDDLVARRPVEDALLRLGGVPLHAVAGGDHVELAAEDLRVRGVGQLGVVRGAAEVPAVALREVGEGGPGFSVPRSLVRLGGGPGDDTGGDEDGGEGSGESEPGADGGAGHGATPHVGWV